jgi:hypothetical protein
MENSHGENMCENGRRVRLSVPELELVTGMEQ